MLDFNYSHSNQYAFSGIKNTGICLVGINKSQCFSYIFKMINGLFRVIFSKYSVNNSVF